MVSLSIGCPSSGLPIWRTNNIGPRRLFVAGVLDILSSSLLPKRFPGIHAVQALFYNLANLLSCHLSRELFWICRHHQP